jgi:hypothetical protein
MRVDCENSVVRSKIDVDAESLDDRVYGLEGAPDRAAIERVAGHLLQSRILDGYACRRACQRANTVTGEKGSLNRFKSDTAAGANDENLGHALSYLF